MNIKPIEVHRMMDGVYSRAMCKTSEVRELEANYKEAIECLIETTNSMIKYGEQFTDPRFNKFLKDIEINVGIIEKATGKKWEELVK